MKLTLLALVITVAISQPAQAQPFCAVQNCHSTVLNEWSPTIPQVQTSTPDYINAPLVVIPAPEPYVPIEPTPLPESAFEPGQFPILQTPIYQNPYFTPKPVELPEVTEESCSYCGL